jgi:hypothetical protein
VRLRHPGWALGPLRVAVNGRDVATESRPGSYATIEREWRDGDVVEARLPMSLTVEAMPDDPSVVALLYGPIVLAADLGASGLDDRRRYGPQAPEMAEEETPVIPTLVAGGVADALARVMPGAGPLVFRTQGLGRPQDVELRPLFRLADRRYMVYFDLLSEGAWLERRSHADDEAKAAAVLDARTVDRVTPGLTPDETAHALEQANSEAGRFEGRLSRLAFWGGGQFSYSLRLPSEGGSAVLGFACWGGESRHHTYEVVIDGEVVARQTLFDDRPGELLRVEVPIPERLTRGRDHLRVGFRPAPNGGSIGAIFDVRILRPGL